jgi:hypothetical protein
MVGIKAHLSPRKSPTLIVRDATARHVGAGFGRSSPISRRMSVNRSLWTALLQKFEKPQRVGFQAITRYATSCGPGCFCNMG